MSSQLDKIVSIYRSLAQIPVLAGAKIMKNGTSIVSNWTERNIETSKSTKILFSQVIDEDFNIVTDLGFGIDVSKELIAALSPQENFRACIREDKDLKDNKKQYLEVWRSRQLQHCVNLTALEIHGDVYVDSEFGSLNWNNAESKIVYIAERKLPKSEPFYKRQSIKSNNKATNDDDSPPSKGTEYDYKVEWGEQLVGKHLSTTVVCDINTEDFTVVDWIPDSLSPGQVMWSPDDSSMIGVAWETEPRRFGLIFCTNRPSFIFMTNLDKMFVVISKKGKAVRSPRFSSDGKYLMWIQRDVGGPHHGCHELVKTAWPLSEEPTIETVIDIVHNEVTIESGEEFTGIYSQALPKRLFAMDGRRALFSSPQKTEVRSYVIDIESKKMIDISDKSSSYSTTIIDVHQDIILASRSSLREPSHIIIAKLPEAGKEHSIVWKRLEENPISVPEPIRSAKIELLHLEHENSEDAVKTFTALYFGNANKDSTLSPLVVWPHGGPHSGFVNSYSLEAALFCMLGFSTLQINFRGSTGAGQNSIMFLPGKIGNADVKDCVLATKEVIEKFSVDAEKCVLLGGSHGGFLVTHLSGQYPDLYKAVVSRNPVIDIASMNNSTDIPDWCHFEARQKDFNDVGPIDEELLIKMRKVSPLVHSHKVKAPTLMCLGSKDKRVPYYQGIEYYHKIKSNGCKARMIVYEDNHSLSTGVVEIDYMINSAMWFIENLK